MRGFTFDVSRDRPLRVLAIGAHADDIEIGCGGTVLRLIEEYPGLEFKWVVLTGNHDRMAEARHSAKAFLGAATASLELPGFQDGFVPYHGREVKLFFETLKPFAPDLILTHCRSDLHQDHRVACELTWNTFRDHLILEFEIPKYDGDLGTPNFYVSLREDHTRKKLDLLSEHFHSQQVKHWYERETFLGLMRIRGLECHVTGHAEAFYCRKVFLAEHGSQLPGVADADGRAQR
jgi:LmbE family N-acetylglucosaminyl deacetylase